MHELSIMEGALNLAFEQTRLAGATRIHLIRLRIGALTGVVPEALEFAFQALKTGTPAESGRLSIEAVPARFWCATCTREFEADDSLPECPDCHARSAQVRAGRELEVASLDVE